MQNFSWSAQEKQLARALFERVAALEGKELLAKFKEKAAGLETLEAMWELQFELRESEREYQRKYDYRYSQLVFVFGRLVREGRLAIEELDGLSEEKRAYIERIATL